MAGGDPLLEMIQALAIEARARCGRDGGERVEVLGGRRLDGGSSVTYRFMLRTPRRPLREGEAVYLLRGEADTLGVVTRACDKGRVEISVDEDLGLTVPEAILVRDDSYLIDALRHRLKAVRRGSAPFRSIGPSRSRFWSQNAGRVHQGWLLPLRRVGP